VFPAGSARSILRFTTFLLLLGFSRDLAADPVSSEPSPVDVISAETAPAEAAPPEEPPRRRFPPSGARLPGLGVEVPEGAGPAGIPEGLHSPDPRSPCYLLIPAGRSELNAPGQLDALFDEAEARGLRIVVRLTETGWTDPDSSGPFPVDAWIAQLGAFLSHAGDRVYAYEILGAPAARHDPRAYAYLLKRMAVVIRAARSGTPILSVPLAEGDAAWLESLLEADAAPYVDVLAVQDLPALAPIEEVKDRLYPRAPMWLVGVSIDAKGAAAAAASAAFQSMAGGVDVMLLGPPASALPVVGETIARLRALLPPGMSPASAAALPFDPKRAVGPRIETLAFFEPDAREGLAVYHTPGAPEGGPVRFALRVPLEWLDLIDPGSDSERRLGTRIPPDSVVEVPARETLLVLRFRIMAEATPLKEKVGIGAFSELTAQEIIAKEREVRTAQAARLLHYEARARVNIHYRIVSLDTSVDLLSDNRLFVYEGRQDYQETALYVDGARWRGKERPSLPFLQPEKIKEIPLDIVLDEGYRYALLGRETVNRRECYVISIDPILPERSLYKGRVYIDTKLFTRVRMDAVQTALKVPLRSNHMTYDFGPIATPSGEFWLPIEIDSQMVFELLGQNLTIEREAGYSDFAINQGGFESRLAAAYASPSPIFRDTNEGLFEVDRSSGEERLRSVSRPRNTLLVMGANVGFNGSPGLPFAGVNFFDFDFRGSGHQVDIAWAGPFADLSWTNPRLTGSESGRRAIALTLGASLNGLPRRDKHATIVGTANSENLNVYSETFRADLAFPMGHFLKWTIGTRSTFNDFHPIHEETDPAARTPATMVEQSLDLRLDVNRGGYIFAPWVEAARRSSWKAWGAPGQPFDPGDADFTRRGFDLLKSFYSSPLRKLSLNLSAYDGKSLDRFSRFELGDFRSARVRGFNGSGIHFDRGIVASAAYAFNLGESVRVDAGLESGWIQSVDDFGPGYERVIGGGIGCQFSGPWSTLVNVRVGRGFSSTIPDKGGGGDLRIVFFRTFDRWNRRPQP
jgi:hypothetical protein